MAYEINEQTKQQLNHIGEVVTGKTNGAPTGSDIATSTLPYTGQVRNTVPELLSRIGWYSVGAWSSNPLIDTENQFVIDGGVRYVPLSLPYQVDSATNPDPSALLGSELKVITDVTDGELTQAQEELLPPGSQIYPESGTLANGMTVPAGTTHLRVLVGGVGKVYQVSLNGSQAYPSGSVSLLDVDSRSATIDGVEYYLEDSYYSVGDSRRYINQPDTDSDNVPLIQRMNEYLKGTGISITLIGYFRVSSALNIYNNFDMSQADILFDDGQFIINDDRDNADYIKTITESGIDFTKATGGLAYLPVTDLSIYDDWANSIVKIESDEVDLYRYEAGTSTPQKKGTIAYLDRFGRMSNGLNHTYNSGNNVTITLYKLNSWIEIKWPKNIQWVARTGGVLRISRNNTRISEYFASEDIPTVGNLSGAVYIRDCGFIEFDNMFTANTGETSGEGATSAAGYDVLASYAYGIDFNNCHGLIGWANFDANYTRKVTFRGGNWYSIVGHYGCADYLITDQAVVQKNITVGTGAFDSSVKAENVTITNGILGIGNRNDYTELKGDLILKDVKLLIDPSIAEDPSCCLFNVFDGAIIPNNDNVQPRTLELPNVYAEDVEIVSKDASVTASCELVYMRNQAYSGTDTIRAPKRIALKNIRGVGVELKLTVYPHGDNQDIQMSIDLDNVKSDQGPVVITTGNLNLSPGGGTDAKINLDIVRSVFSSNAEPLGMYGDGDSEITVSRSKMVNDLDQFSGGALYGGKFSMDNSTIELDENYNGQWSMQGSVTKVTNCVFDGRKYFDANAVNPNVATLVMNQSGNVALSCDSTYSSVTPQGSGYISPCPQTGEQGSF